MKKDAAHALLPWRAAVCLAACLIVAACTSVERFADRQQRHRRYVDALQTLSERATRADIYRALPPQTLPAPPRILSITGLGAMATEYYPLDADYEVAVPFLYANSRFIFQRTQYHFTGSFELPQDMIFGEPSIERRTTKRFPW